MNCCDGISPLFLCSPSFSPFLLFSILFSNFFLPRFLPFSCLLFSSAFFSFVSPYAFPFFDPKIFFSFFPPFVGDFFQVQKRRKLSHQHAQVVRIKRMDPVRVEERQ